MASRTSRQALVRDLERHRHRHPLRERLQREREAVLDQHGRVQAAGDLAQVRQAGVELPRGLRQQVRHGLGTPLQRRAGHAQLQGDADQPRLRAVVQVALEPAALVVAGLHEPGAGGDQVRTRLRGGDGERHELGEVAQAVLGVGRQGCSLAIATAPQSTPVTTIGAAAVER